MGFDPFTARCGCGAIVRLPNLKARASSVRCDGCARGSPLNKQRRDAPAGMQWEPLDVAAMLAAVTVYAPDLPLVGPPSGKITERALIIDDPARIMRWGAPYRRQLCAAQALLPFLAQLASVGGTLRSPQRYDRWQGRKGLNRIKRNYRLALDRQDNQGLQALCQAAETVGARVLACEVSGVAQVRMEVACPASYFRTVRETVKAACPCGVDLCLFWGALQVLWGGHHDLQDR